MNILNNDTICAPATAAGGALAIIRISGPDALSIVSTLCPLRFDTIAANTTHFTHLVEYDAVSQHPHPIDEALITSFRALTATPAKTA